MNFFDQAGKISLGSRLRFLGDKFSSEATDIYKSYGTNLRPKWFPVFYVLSQSNEHSASGVADVIGHSHVSVAKILTEMAKAGLINETSDKKDRRRTIVTLSKLGAKIAKTIETQYIDVNKAIDEMSAEATHDLWAALAEWEDLLAKKSFLKRVLDAKKDREIADIQIESYKPKYKKAFRDLNEEWITTYFKMEKPDIEALSNPKKYILDRGGYILVATLNNKPVGVCALLRKNKKVYELAKMAVSQEARGKHVGLLLGNAIIEKAKSLKAERIFLESNTVLTPAIRLYHKLGFKKIIGPPTPYERCNIQMELMLE